MDAATINVIMDETADLQEQVRTLNLGDGQHTIASCRGVAIAALIEGGKVVEYIANDHTLNQEPPVNPAG
jgi:hypothetical protein